MKLFICILFLFTLSAAYSKTTCEADEGNQALIWNNTCRLGVDTKDLTDEETKYLFKRLEQKGYHPYEINIELGEPWRALYLVPDIQKEEGMNEKTCKVDLSIKRKGATGYTTYSYRAFCTKTRFLFLSPKYKCQKAMKKALRDLSRCLVSPF